MLTVDQRPTLQEVTETTGVEAGVDMEVVEATETEGARRTTTTSA